MREVLWSRFCPLVARLAHLFKKAWPGVPLMQGLLHLAAWLPWCLLRATGRTCGALLYHWNGREARNARANLKIAYPDMAHRERERLARRSLQESGTTLAELPRIWLRGSGGRVDPDGLPEHMQELLAQGRGLILAVPHHGNWEMVTSGLHPQLPVTGLYRPPRQAWLEPIMLRGREIACVRMVATNRSGIRSLYEALRNGETVIILPDQVPKSTASAAVSAPFFGRPAPTMVLLNRLAARHKTPVLLVWAERRPDGRYRMRYFLPDPAIAEKDPLISASTLNQAIAHCIAHQPAQYQWAYRRFLPVDAVQDNPYA